MAKATLVTPNQVCDVGAEENWNVRSAGRGGIAGRGGRFAFCAMTDSRSNDKPRLRLGSFEPELRG